MVCSSYALLLFFFCFQRAWDLIDGADKFTAPDKVSGLSALNLEGEASDDAADELLPYLDSEGTTNYHVSLEQGGVLEEKAAIWRAPDSYGALVSAVRMVERSVKEHQLKGLLEATHPEPSILEDALSRDLDNAEVATSAKMLELKVQRREAVDAMVLAQEALQVELDANDGLKQAAQQAREEQEQAAGAHVESYADLKIEFRKLMVERQAANKAQSLAMGTASAALNHLLHDKDELLAEINVLYSQLANVSSGSRGVAAGGSESENLRAFKALAKKKQQALEEDAKQLRAMLAEERRRAAERAELDESALERYKAETQAKMRLLEESLRLQDESDVIAAEARAQIRDEIQAKFDKQLRALLTEIEESEAKTAEMSTKFKMLTGNLGKDASELENLRKEVERLGAENKAMRAREVKRKAKEDKMAELASTLVREAAANDLLAARLKQTQAKLDDFTRRGLVATTVNGVRTAAAEPSLAASNGGATVPLPGQPLPANFHGGGGLARRLPVPSLKSGARSADFNEEVNAKLENLTNFSFASGSYVPRTEAGTGAVGPPGPRPIKPPNAYQTTSI